MRTYYPWLDLLRLASAIGVALFHHTYWSWAGNVPGIDHDIFATYPEFPFAANFTWFGWVGVDVFFVISGFVIANSAIKTSPINFLISRALRLYPSVWVCSTATFFVLLFFANLSTSKLLVPYIRSLILFPKGQWIDGVYWTLAVEISFYALVFLLLISKRVTLLHTAWFLTVYSGIFNVVAFLVVLGVIPSPRLYEFFAMHRSSIWALSLLYHGCLFALGIWFFIAANRRLTVLEKLGLAMAFLSAALEIFNTCVFGIPFVKYLPGGGSALLPLAPIAVFTAAMCIVGFAARRIRFSPARVGSAGILRSLGLITYPFYLTHNVIGAGVTRLLIAAGLDAGLSICIALSALLALCLLFCSKVEPALRGLLKRILAYLGLRSRERTIDFAIMHGLEGPA
jgi:peptidoglycan/LPS O-acetylase OafA/YrhL